MQRFCTKLRSISLHPNLNLSLTSVPRRLIHHSPSPRSTLGLGFATTTKWSFVSPSNPPTSIGSLSVPHYFVQVRNITSKDKMAKWKKKWRPRTPITSKVKKVKIKFYSSYKDRFRPLNDGTIRRWKEGKRHNAHLKSKKSKRRLRQPGLVPPAYAKVMKKLNFCN
ncbi:Ribosomal protein L35 [Raphanus sativus]|uniref:Uncharacterized protein LOC108809135 n=1 Tax=Raphanus sativus TaxID=3726 RepID=A0A6J0JM87_RAPSA|nr:uncharacterized protein LOC108809135 [Raphanus sativus]KAJ4888693.1 Ribosomal protein L35 [Raphanus sativus]